jgi:hypothetical protein
MTIPIWGFWLLFISLAWLAISVVIGKPNGKGPRPEMKFTAATFHLINTLLWALIAVTIILILH